MSKACNGRFRAECLNQRWFLTLADAAEKLGAWRRRHNNDQAHSAIGYNVPSVLHFPDGATSPPP